MSTIANITVEPAPDNPSVQIIHLSGEVDESNLPDFEQAVKPLVLDPSRKVLLFDFDGLKFISSKVIGQFAYLYTTLAHSQRQLVLARMDENIKDIFALVGLDQIIPTYPDVNTALQSFNQTPAAA
ncbi:STAS domain-containing protein [Candidatus Peregrinibacteria bacterium]|nr:STAS domain-containing protein [Candidatus Peregrinibacteria bacterium]